MSRNTEECARIRKIVSDMLMLEEVLGGACSFRISQDAFTKLGWNEGARVRATQDEVSRDIGKR